MKNKHKRLIMQKYPWYDYSFFLELMELWFREAAYKHENQGYCVNSDKVAKQLRIAAHLCKRINEDDYADPHWFGKVNIESNFSSNKSHNTVRFIYLPSKKIYRLCVKRRAKQRQADLDMLTRLINKNLFGWWD